MPRRLSATQARVLLTTYAADPDVGWQPDRDWDPAGWRAAPRLIQLGLLQSAALRPAPAYVLTEAGRTALGLTLQRPARTVRQAARQALAWLGMPAGAYRLVSGRNLPSVQLEEGRASLRGCQFAVVRLEDGWPFQTGPLAALANEPPDDDLLWAALARFVTDAGFAVSVDTTFADQVGFWGEER